ncbi:c-type cytochrome [Dokdonia sp. Asnod1-B02]|uniref:c-type cytochrome n=1 Tax=Dokdonia sp. Asnod1-B02 TaxID=3160573 RepID=UPI0038683F15
MKLLLSLFTAGASVFLFFAKAEKEIYTSQDPLAQSIERGAEVYQDFCIQCHLGKGEGVAETFPPLAGSDWLTEDCYKEAIKAVKYGQQGPIIVNGVAYDGVMANLELYEDEVADVMNYIMNNWGNTQKEMITEEEVKAISK